tara:strand:- start:199 stop:828 length:630 start_codon:yes stop_codon:yes gene_type:complete
MNFFNLFKKTKIDNFSQSGQDQFAYNLTGKNGIYLEIGAHHPITNSNTYKLEKECNWRGIGVEYDHSFKNYWQQCKERKNEIIWDDAFNVNYLEILNKKDFPRRINYLSCDIEPPKNTFEILRKIINYNIIFDFISFEHDKYNIGEEYEKISETFLKEKGYKIAIKDVYSRTKKYKIYETWFVYQDIIFEETKYGDWKKKYYKKNQFQL